MKLILKISAIFLPLLLSAPSFARVNWGVDIRFGSPPPRHEIIVARPYPDAYWVPGYYNTYPGHRYLWVPGSWRRNEHFEEHRGYSNHEFNERHDRGGDRDRREFHRDNDHDRGRDTRDNFHRGRIR